MTGLAVSMTFIKKLPESAADLDFLVMVNGKSPALLGLPLRTPCWLRVKPGGKPATVHVPVVTFEDVNFILGFGEEKGGGYGKPTMPSGRGKDGVLVTIANDTTEPRKKAARKERVRDIVKIRNQNTQQAPCHRIKRFFLAQGFQVTWFPLDVTGTIFAYRNS